MNEPARITIDVKRCDNQVTRLEGTAGLAVACTADRDERGFGPLTDTPVVSLRADTPFQLTLLLASVIATVEASAPGTTTRAVLMASYMSAGRPELSRQLPPEARRG